MADAEAAGAGAPEPAPAGGGGGGAQENEAPPEGRRAEKPPDSAARRERKPSPSSAARRPGAGAGAGSARAEAPAGGAGAKEKDIMKMVVQQSKKEAASKADMSAIVVGTASCGKSTLLKGFLDRDEEPKATLALEYQFARKKDGRKEVMHLWEVGGGTVMQNLLDVPLTEASVRTATVVIVADLSKPEEVFAGISYWLTRLRERLQAIEKKLKLKEATAKLMDQLRERAAKRFSETANRFGEKQDDNVSKEGVVGRGVVKHTGVNVIIVANKFDLFAKKDPEIKKVMARTLRFLAHTNGASLLYFAKSEKPLITKLRALLSAEKSKGKEDNHLKPLFIPAGADTLQAIGLPPALDKSAMEKASTPLDLWKGVFEGYFCKNGESPQLPTGPATIDDLDPDGKFEEKAVDSALYHKNLELKLYRDSQKADQTAEMRDARAGAQKPMARKPSTSASRPAAAPSAASSAAPAPG